MSYETFYHYTDSYSISQIKSSGVILASSRGIGGPGVYLTMLEPSAMKGRIAINNYDGSTQTEGRWVERLYNQGKVDYYIEIKLKSNEVENLTWSERSVYLHKGNINLRYLLHRVWIGRVGGEKKIFSEGVENWLLFIGVLFIGVVFLAFYFAL